MSFDVYLQCFRNGAPAGIRRDAIRAAFAPHLQEAELDRWVLHYSPSDSAALHLSAAGLGAASVHHLTVARPCRDLRLWDGLAALLQTEHTVFYCPGADALVVATLEALAHVPPELSDCFADPAVVITSGAALERHVSR